MKKNKTQTTTPTAKSAPRRSPFAWQNCVLTGVALLLIITGCLLMLPESDVRNTPGGRYAPTPGPGAFDARRIRAAPIPCFLGFVLMIPAILYVPREQKAGEKESQV